MCLNECDEVIGLLFQRLAQEAENIAIQVQKIENSIFLAGKTPAGLGTLLHDLQGLDLIKQQVDGMVVYLNNVAADWKKNGKAFNPDLSANNLPLKAQRDHFRGTVSFDQPNTISITLWSDTGA